MRFVNLILIFLLAFSPIVLGENPPTPPLEPPGEVKPEVTIVQEYPLVILCPDCHAILYYIEIPEFFAGELMPYDSFFPENPAMPKLKTGVYQKRGIPECWRCHGTSWMQPGGKILKGPFKGQDGSMVFTSKGWLPRRYRPGT